MRRFLQTLRVIPCAMHRSHFIELHVSRALAALKNGDFALLDGWMATLPAETYEPLVWRLASSRHARLRLQAWSGAMPTSPHPPLIAAYGDVVDAWAVRGETYANDIPFLRRRRYPKIMTKAYEKFTCIVERNPADAMALAGLIHCNIVVGAGEGKRTEWLNQVLATSGFHTPAIYQYARGTLPRWGGEYDEHVRFAEWVVQQAPAGSCSHIVAAQAVLDDALTVAGEDDNHTMRGIAGQLGDGETAAWLRRAILKWADAVPETLQDRLQDIASHQGDSYHGICMETFAFAAYFAGAKDEARLLLTTLKGRLQADVWEMLTPPVPGWLGAVGLRHRAAHLVHDRVCRDLELDPRQVCA
ncbi:hypothetical protein C1924_18135 [Stenotrophomonas sp. ESTM1D_MKCIP4_1]|nr:hypothetical protein C1924_18135 [Stenotrophomonas sp. ESTM1D_MKCIP4_1]